MTELWNRLQNLAFSFPTRNSITEEVGIRCRETAIVTEAPQLLGWDFPIPLIIIIFRGVRSHHPSDSPLSCQHSACFPKLHGWKRDDLLPFSINNANLYSPGLFHLSFQSTQSQRRMKETLETKMRRRSFLYGLFPCYPNHLFSWLAFC